MDQEFLLKIYPMYLNVSIGLMIAVIAVKVEWDSVWLSLRDMLRLTMAKCGSKVKRVPGLLFILP
jgi:hypothetical protein